MAGSVFTITYDDGDMGGVRGPGAVRKILVDWTSDDTAGTASGTTKKISGYLLAATTNPGATAPTANYDITITDDTHSANVLGNCYDDLADRHTSNTERVDFFLTGAANVGARPAVCDKLDIAVANAGNSKVGQIVLYWTPGVV